MSSPLLLPVLLPLSCLFLACCPVGALFLYSQPSCCISHYPIPGEWGKALSDDSPTWKRILMHVQAKGQTIGRAALNVEVSPEMDADLRHPPLLNLVTGDVKHSTA